MGINEKPNSPPAANAEHAIERIFELLPDALKQPLIRKKTRVGRVGKSIEKACKILMLMEILEM
jgi:hypothetical protein